MSRQWKFFAVIALPALLAGIVDLTAFSAFLFATGFIVQTCELADLEKSHPDIFPPHLRDYP